MTTPADTPDLAQLVLTALPTHALSPLADRFGVSTADIARALAWLDDNGLATRYAGKNRDGRPVSLHEWRRTELGQAVAGDE